MNDTLHSEMGLEQEANSATTVGAFLRASRVRRGEELVEVAAQLRIRNVYVEAIEEGRFDLLPGNTYAVGFIRTYAEYLGLDGERVVERYRDEITHKGVGQDLTFPAVVPENGIPRAAMVLVGLLVVALGYGAWIFLNSSPRFQVVAVDPVPEQIQRVTEQQEAPQVTVRSANPSQPASAIAATAEIDVSGPTPAADPETVTGGAHPAVQNTLDKIAETLAAVPETRPEAQSTEEPHPRPVQPDPTPAAENSLATEAVGTPPAAVTQQSTPVASSSAGTSSAQPALDPAVESPAPQQSGTRIQPEPEPDEISPSEETSPLSRPETPATAQTAYAIPSPQQRPLESAAPESTESALVGSESVPEQIAALPAGDTNPGSEQGLDQASAAIPTVDVSTTVAALPPQIVIRAVIDSWIQVRDMEENKLVMTKLLRSGDTYEVPARRGLSLLTGNAGALEIEVDGNLVPSIGLVGTVRRNVVLDAEKLTSGTAVVP